MTLIETYKTIIGEKYELYSTGKSFKSRLITPSRTLKSGKVVKEQVQEQRHATLENALNSKIRGTKDD